MGMRNEYAICVFCDFALWKTFLIHAIVYIFFIGIWLVFDCTKICHLPWQSDCSNNITVAHNGITIENGCPFNSGYCFSCLKCEIIKYFCTFAAGKRCIIPMHINHEMSSNSIETLKLFLLCLNYGVYYGDLLIQGTSNGWRVWMKDLGLCIVHCALCHMNGNSNSNISIQLPQNDER